jgi:DNA-binding transcriptional MocR family regulator
MVAPTYYLAANIFKDCGYGDRIIGIPEDREGLEISCLQSHVDKLEREEESPRPAWQKCTYRYVFYGVPTFSNPTGSIMSLTRRKQLLELARKYNMLLITDDVYDLLTYDVSVETCPSRLVTLDSPLSTKEGFGNTISNCSFSKLLAPGLRFGFIQARKALVHELSTQFIPNQLD